MNYAAYDRQKRTMTVPTSLCKCGCGLPVYDTRFCAGHSVRKRLKMLQRKRNPTKNGKKKKSKEKESVKPWARW